MCVYDSKWKKKRKIEYVTKLFMYDTKYKMTVVIDELII